MDRQATGSPSLPRWPIGALFFVNGAAFATWVSRIPAVQEQLALSPAALGAALAGLGAGSFAAMPVAGWLIARFGSRLVVTLATLACCIAFALPGLARDAMTLAAALAVFGAVMGAMDVAMNAQGVELEHRGTTPMMATFHALFSLGGMSGAAIGGAIAARGVSVLPHFALIAMALAALAAAALPRLIDPPPAERGASGRLQLSWRFVGLGVLACCFFVSEGAIADWSPVYLGSVLGTGPGTAAAGYAVFSAAMVVGRLTGDWLTQRVGRARLVRAGSLLAAAALAAALVLQSVSAAIVGLLLVGLGFSVAVPLVFSAAGRLDRRSSGTGLAAVTTAGYVGFLSGPPAIGVIADRFTLPRALAIVVALALVGAALAKCVDIDAPDAE